MRICRIALSYPTKRSPGAGLVAYYLCKYIKVPSLYLTIYRDREEFIPNSANFDLEAIKVPIEMSSNSLNQSIHKEDQNIFQRLEVYVKIIISGRSIKFLLNSIQKTIAFKPDLICCHSNLTLYNGLFFNLFFQKKFVLHIHAMSDAIAICNLPILRLIASRASRVYCVSGQVFGRLKKSISPLKLRLTSTGVDPKIFYNMNIKRKKQIIQVGQLMWYKGHKYLINAMPKILKIFPDYKLIIVGNGKLKEEITHLINNNNLQDSIEMLSNLSHQELRKLYSESSLMIMPSLFEGLPKVLLEAFACGLPAVITDACNAENISVDRAVIVKKKSSKALSKAIVKILSDKLMWEKYSKNCLDIIETHNWEKISKEIYEDYKLLLNHKT